MSAFGFTDEPAEETGEEGFSFIEEKSEFNFGEPENTGSEFSFGETPQKTEVKPADVPKKGQTRAIGISIGKKKTGDKPKPAFAKFAKKPEATVSPKPVAAAKSAAPVVNSQPIVVQKTVSNEVLAPPPSPPPTLSAKPTFLASDISESQKVYSSFSNQLIQFHQIIEGSYFRVQKLKEVLEQLEKEQCEALEKEKYDQAEKINSKIASTKLEMHQLGNAYSRTIDDAILLATNAPGHMLSYSTEMQVELPKLCSKRNDLEKQLNAMVDQQQNDKLRIEVEKEQNKGTICNLQAPINQHKEQHELLKQQYDKKVNEISAPFISQINSLKSEKESKEQQIAELLAKVEELKRHVREINGSISKEEKGMAKAVDTLIGDLRIVESDEKQLAGEINRVNQKVKDIEAPFAQLVTMVNSRENEIVELNKSLENVNLEISSAQTASEQSESGARIINSMCQAYFKYSDEKSAVSQSYNQFSKQVIDLQNRRNAITGEILELRTRCQRDEEFASDSKAKLPQLESSKQSAVASKNFKAAQQLTSQIKDIREMIDSIEKGMSAAHIKLESLEEEAKVVSNQIRDAEMEVDTNRTRLLELDYYFLQSSVKELRSLFDLSPFGEKLLAPLYDMLQFTLKYTDPPKEKMSLEEIETKINEINTKIEEAAAKEDFDTAAALQEQLEVLESKRERLQK